MFSDMKIKLAFIALNLLIAAFLIGNTLMTSSARYQGSQDSQDKSDMRTVYSDPPVKMGRPLDGKIQVANYQNVLGAVNDPITTTIELNGLKTKLKQTQDSFSSIDNPDWLLDADFTVTNTSSKVITLIVMDITVIFDENGGVTGKNGEAFAEYRLLHYGKYANSMATEGKVRMLPGDKISAKVDPERYKTFLKVLRRQGITSLSSVKMYIQKVEFDDGTGWQLGYVTQN